MRGLLKFSFQCLVHASPTSRIARTDRACIDHVGVCADGDADDFAAHKRIPAWSKNFDKEVTGRAFLCGNSRARNCSSLHAAGRVNFIASSCPLKRETVREAVDAQPFARARTYDVDCGAGHRKSCCLHFVCSLSS